MNLLFEAAGQTTAVPLLFQELQPPCSTTAATPATSLERVYVESEDERLAAELERVSDVVRAEERVSCESRLHNLLETERIAITHVCANFAKARQKYFSDAEEEIVRLSLSIAERIMQREASLDPLLLQGVVHSALRKLADPEGTVLHVPTADADRWRAAMRVVPSLQIRADETMEAGECRLHALAGDVDLGVRTQLAEVESGFFDLLARRPA